MTEFASFWQGGFEGADYITRQHVPLSMIESNGHLQKVFEDYTALKEFGIKTVRESVGWRLCDRPEGYDFSSVYTRMLAAKKAGIQICWTISHYGWPEDTDIFAADFVPRFARFCGVLATYLAPFFDSPPVYSPVNEISFTSWAISVGFFPSSREPSHEAGVESKRQLVRAAIAGCDAIWHADPRARMLHCDPIINIVPPPGGEALQHEAEQHSLAQYQAWDMLCGRLEPELGGAMRYLDLIGANYYHDNQWEMMTHRKLWWHLGDARRAPLHQMLHKLHQRYGRPILLAETSHVGSGRGAWIQHIAGEIAQALLNGIKITGVCLYPIIDRPDWEDNNRWHQSGLWDVPEYTSENYLRVINPPYAVAIKEAQASLRQFVDQLDKRNSDEDKPMTVQKLIVFSHLRWDFVFQRPQHLLTRLAREYQIIFVEEPVYQPGEAAFHFSYPAANVTVARPHTSIQQPGFHDDQLVQLTPLMEQLCHEDEQPLVWFYTPMALPLLANFNASAVIYDCMDELAAFANAPRQLLQRESALLRRASLVFTGGPSLYAAKKDRHPSVYCFPSSVDVVHFEQALDRTNEHPLQEHIPHPRLGYYGVIDERMDTALLAQLADAHPEWQIVCVGPVVKIDPASLPVRNNIHYLGQQPYQALPQFLAGWDVCLMPFMLNESTQFISPTKVLEYMAAALPVVSTPIKDVAEPYGDVVFIAKDAGSFIAHCERALALTDAQTARMVQRMKQIVSLTSWDSTAQQMKMLMSGAAEKATPLQEPELSQKKSSAFSLTEVASSWLKRSS